jgi:hypothetical protein
MDSSDTQIILLCITAFFSLAHFSLKIYSRLRKSNCRLECCGKEIFESKIDIERDKEAEHTPKDDKDESPPTVPPV